jgi:RNA polymerase sigma factor (TIGR02999 family)
LPGGKFFSRVKTASFNRTTDFAWEAEVNSMDPQMPEDLTQLLLRWRSGDETALDQLMPLVYSELRRLARQCLRGERAGHTLQTTGLVNEAYLRLVRSSQVPWHDRAHFFAVAARLMRRVLVDEGRMRHSQKRGGTLLRVSLDEAMMVSSEQDADVVALDEALTRLAKFAPRKCQVVELRFFGGLAIEETASVLNVSTDIVKREWRTAKLWLLNELTPSEADCNGSGTMGED